MSKSSTGECEAEEFQCPEQCIPMSNRCDVLWHCENGYDELDCSGEQNAYNIILYQCGRIQLTGVL